jgi:hypothetical protein
MIEATLSTIVDAQAHRYQAMQRTRRAFGIELTQPVGGYRPRFAPSPIQYHVP